MSAKEPTPMNRERISGIARGFMGSRALLTAHELGVFGALAEGPKSSLEVAWAVGADPRGVDRLMRALVGLELLELRADGHFANTPAAAEHLVPGRSGFLGDLNHVAHLWTTWGTLTEAVRLGGKVPGPEINDRGERWLEGFITAMHALAKPAAAGVIARMGLPAAHRMLDVGGGPGTYAMAFVGAAEGRTATVFDLPNVIPLTRRFVGEAGLTDRVSYVVGDMNKDELADGGYDVVFVSAIIHMLSPEECARLMEKAARALEPGGTVVVQDFIMEEDRVRPTHGAMFALNMLVGTDDGDTYTSAEVAEWMKAAGLANVRTVDTERGTALVMGDRPA